MSMSWQRDAEGEGPDTYAAVRVPDPIRLTPTGPGYRSFGCPESGCHWHTHYTDSAEGDARYRSHYEAVHGS
jgi:hypothetical protein